MLRYWCYVVSSYKPTFIHLGLQSRVHPNRSSCLLGTRSCPRQQPSLQGWVAAPGTASTGHSRAHCLNLQWRSSVRHHDHHYDVQLHHCPRFPSHPSRLHLGCHPHAVKSREIRAGKPGDRLENCTDGQVAWPLEGSSWHTQLLLRWALVRLVMWVEAAASATNPYPIQQLHPTAPAPCSGVKAASLRVTAVRHVCVLRQDSQRKTATFKP